MSEAEQPVSVGSSGRGYLAVLAMFSLAILAATFAWYVNFNRGRRTLEYFGPAAATLIRTAPKVELLADSGGNIDISKAPGLINARTSLLNDASYEWPAAESTLNLPKYALRFSDEASCVDVWFDLENDNIQMSGGRTMAKLRKKTADGWRAYIARQVNAN